MGLMDDAVPERYEKNPLLAVLENYVLDAIGKLDPEQSAKLNEILTRAFGGTDWKAAVREQFDLPPSTDEDLRTMWKQYVEENEEAQADHSPEAFAREVVDEMFKDLGH